MHSARQTAASPPAALAAWRQAPHLRVVKAPARASMPTNPELHAWIHAVATAADRQAFAALFRHFAPRIKGFLMHSGTPAELAEELAQETMVALWRRASSFDPARAAVTTWLFTIARNLRIDHHRRRGAMPLDEIGDDGLAERQPAAAEDAPDERLLAGQRERSVQRALAELPAEQALVLRLSFFEERAHARIAQELGIPLGTVKSRIRLAVAQLRRTLDGFES
jgi:RNA polymerase sigma-70 factor (ECF subfamily)